MPDGASVLTVDSVVPYLLEYGVLNEAAVADGEFVVDGVARRNLNLRVSSPGGPGYFVKQADSLSFSSFDGVSAEGRFYTGVRSQRPDLTALLPDLVLYDPHRCVLVLGLLPLHRTLREVIVTGGDRRFPTHVWHALGESLGRVHRTAAGDPSSVPPFIHTVDPVPDALAAIGPAALRVMEVVQTSGIREELLAVAELWDPSAFTHGDVRVDNILIKSGLDGDDLRLVDWEMSGRADPMWDIAGCLESAITMSLGRFPGEELCLPVVQQTARATWAGYHAINQPEACTGTASAIKAAGFTAARLVLTALELSGPGGEPSRRAISCLQIAQNVLADPERAVTDLFALAGNP